MNFYQLYQVISPVKYDLLDLYDNPDGKGWQTMPLEDMARYASDDVEALAFEKQRLGINNTRLGDPLDDEGLAKYTGIPWKKK